jgi:hypothetical protein
VNAAGDIPDKQVFVPFTTPDGAVVVSVPQGWARSSDGPATVFTDKFNSVRVEDAPRPSAADVASSRAEDVPQLQTSVPGFALGDVHMVRRTAGAAVLITYEADSAPNAVTGKSVRESVERIRSGAVARRRCSRCRARRARTTWTRGGSSRTRWWV